MSRTISAKKSWFSWLQDHCIASTGKNGSLIGMRRSFWGDKAYVIKCCSYCFMVTESIFRYIKSINDYNS